MLNLILCQSMFLHSKIKNTVKSMGINVFYKTHMSSTNDYINYKYITDDSPILILTNNQRNPRGQRGSLWINHQFHSFSFTLCLKLPGKIVDYENLSMVVGLSILESCKKFGVNHLRLKPPNDIIENNRKVCGILIENILTEDNYFYSAIGIGFNISIPEHLLNLIEGQAGNISINPKDLEKLMPEVIKSIILCSSELKKGGFNQFRKSYNKNKYVRT